MKRGQFVAHISKDAKLEIVNLPVFRAILKYLAGKRVLLTIGQDKPGRSTQANRYYWGVVVRTLADELGYTADEMHEALKWKFLRLEAEPERPLETVRSTAQLKTDEMEDFMDRVRMWAASDLGIVIPLPGERP